MEKTLLNYDSVEISFDGTPVVHDISFSLQPGEILGLVGESGSGKSTLIKAAMGLLGDTGLVTRGDITFRGKNLVDMPESELRLDRIFFCFGFDGRAGCRTVIHHMANTIHIPVKFK